MTWIMAALLGLGGLVCCLNFYLSFLRYPIHRMMGGKKEDYHWVSGFPICGSLFVAISLLKFWHPPWLLTLGVLLILIDTGGFHWFAGTMFYCVVFLKQEKHPATTSVSPEDEVV